MTVAGCCDGRRVAERLLDARAHLHYRSVSDFTIIRTDTKPVSPRCALRSPYVICRTTPVLDSVVPVGAPLPQYRCAAVYPPSSRPQYNPGYATVSDTANSQRELRGSTPATDPVRKRKMSPRKNVSAAFASGRPGRRDDRRQQSQVLRVCIGRRLSACCTPV